MRHSGNHPSAFAENDYQLMPGCANSVAHGVPHRLQRISPDIALRYKEWIIPVHVGGSIMTLQATVQTLG